MWPLYKEEPHLTGSKCINMCGCHESYYISYAYISFWYLNTILLIWQYLMLISFNFTKFRSDDIKKLSNRNDG